MQISEIATGHTLPHKTPFLLTDLSQIQSNYNRLQNALPGSEIYFAIKSNPDQKIIAHLNSLGSRFDVASWEETKLCLKSNVDPSKLLFSAPVKKIQDIKKSVAAGITLFVSDSLEELEKLAKYAPQCKVILRIYVKSSDSICPMFNRFGALSSDALDHLEKAIQLGLHPIGLTFHVGSQCLDAENWQMALSVAEKIWLKAQKSHIQLELIDLGGGLPVSYAEEVPPIEGILAGVHDTLSNNFPGLKKVYIEPGRYMTDQASVMVTSVIGIATRGHIKWLHLDVGGFNGLFEIIEGFDYEIKTEHPDRPLVKYSVSGPTCDGLDIIRKEIFLPEIMLGDRLYIMNAGAYSTSLKNYNGFSWAQSITLNSDPSGK